VSEGSIDIADEAPKDGPPASGMRNDPSELSRATHVNAKLRFSVKISLMLGLGVLVGIYALGLIQFIRGKATVRLDIFGIWSWARFEIEQGPARIYDHAAQSAYLHSLDPNIHNQMLFPYPPPYLMLIRPLGWLSFPAAWASWSGGTLALLIVMLALVGRPERGRTVLVALLAPAIVVNLLYGQNGFLTAALVVGGIGLAPSRPVLGGFFLGLLLYKPQLALLVGVALIAGRLWRAAYIAVLTVIAVVATSIVAFGVEPWIAWMNSLPEFLAQLDADRQHLTSLMPTAFAEALWLGAGDHLAFVAQSAVTSVAVVGVAFAFHRKADRPSAAVLAVGTILATPYAFLYDLPLVAAGAALFIGERWSSLSVTQVVVLEAALFVPLGMLLDMLPPVATVLHLVLFAMLLLPVMASSHA
jgi:Glycosyltransferase family 87